MRWVGRKVWAGCYDMKGGLGFVRGKGDRGESESESDTMEWVLRDGWIYSRARICRITKLELRV